MLLVTAAEMARIDHETIEDIGIPGIVLMENAARGAASFFLEVVPDLPRRRVTVVAGSGNNAGDGFVLARLFHGRGIQVRVVCLRPADQLRGDALTNFKIIDRLGVPIRQWREDGDFAAQWSEIADSEVIVDAILGTGLKSEVRGLYRQVLDGLNQLAAPVLAVDVPSGIDAGTGRVMGAAVHCLATATFGCAKIGQAVPPGSDYTGRLGVIDIGIPPAVVHSQKIQRWWLDDELLSGWIERRSRAAHKGHAGHVAVLAGSTGKTGAAALVCQGAARAGAGLVTLFIPKSLNPILEVKLTEAMTFPISETAAATPDRSALLEVLPQLAGKAVLAVGPGVSLDPRTQELVCDLIVEAPCPLVFDADALTILAGRLELLGQLQQTAILTPHPGEMARLIHSSTQTVQEDRLAIAAQFSREHRVVLVLKGHRTVIAAPDGRLAINGSGNPAMASGGMGDALTGLIAGFVAQGLEPFRAACLGVYVHGAAADNCVAHVASRGLLASDLLDRIPAVIGRIEGFRNQE